MADQSGKHLWGFVVLLIVIGITTCVVLVVKSGRKPAVVIKPGLETVYVDLDKLSLIYPSSALLSDLSKEVSSLSNRDHSVVGDSKTKAVYPGKLPDGVSAEVADKLRKDMSDRILGDADDALTRWEQDRKKVLNVRLAWNRRNMMTRASDAILFNKNDIYEQSAIRAKDIELKYGLNLLNLRIGQHELQNGLDILGYKPPEVPPKLTRITNDLGRLTALYEDDKEGIAAGTNDEIARVRSETLADVNSSLSREKVRATVAIQSDVEKAKAQIADRLTMVTYNKPKRPLVIPDVAGEALAGIRPEIATAIPSKIDVSGLVESSERLRSGIRREVRRFVIDEAQIMGVKVVFDNNAAGRFRDMTPEFLRIIRSRVW